MIWRCCYTVRCPGQTMWDANAVHPLYGKGTMVERRWPHTVTVYGDDLRVDDAHHADLCARRVIKATFNRCKLVIRKRSVTRDRMAERGKK